VNASRSIVALLACGSLLAACQRERELTPLERAAKDRAECHVIAVDASSFDPTVAEEPARTISETAPAGGDVIGSGAVAKGALGGAAVGAIGGAVVGEAGGGAAAGAAAGALIGGIRRHKETKKPVTTTRTNPAYTAYVEKKNAYRAALDRCLSARAQGTPE
jgi:hypothetical protein